MPHILWHKPTLYYSHLWLLTITPIFECLAVELSLPFLILWSVPTREWTQIFRMRGEHSTTLGWWGGGWLLYQCLILSGRRYTLLLIDWKSNMHDLTNIKKSFYSTNVWTLVLIRHNLTDMWPKGSYK